MQLRISLILISGAGVMMGWEGNRMKRDGMGWDGMGLDRIG